MDPLTNSIRPDVPPHDQHNGSAGALNATPAHGGETTPAGIGMTVVVTDPPLAAAPRRRPWLFPLAGVVLAAGAAGVWFAVAGAGAHADVNNAPGAPEAPAAARK